MAVSEKKIPAHQRIYEALLAEIKTLHSNARLPTEVALAGRFGVSRLTAHKVVMRLQQEGVVVRRRRGGTYVAANAKHIATAGVGRRNGTFVIVHPNWFSYDFWLKADHAVRLASRHHLQPEKYELSPDFKMRDLFRHLQDRTDIRGILLLPPGGKLSREDREALHKTPHRCVMLSMLPRDDPGIHCVTQDYAAVGTLAAKTLLGRGHTRIAYLSNEPWHEGSRMLRDALRAAMRKAGLPASALVCPQGHRSTWIQPDDVAYKAACTALQRKHPPTGWLLDSITGSIALMRIFSENNIRCPGEASFIIAGYVPRAMRYYTPEIASIAAPAAQLIEKAFDLLLKPPCPPRVHLLQPVLHRAESL